jgi:Leucine-rich repeat (LRR) protein
LDGSEPGLRRLEIRDYILPDLVVEEKESQLFFRSVRELSLSYNQIQEIHLIEEEEGGGGNESPNSNAHLKLLDLSTNNLTTFRSVREMSGLTVLDLSHNRIESISLEWLVGLESLNLRSNSIEELREDVFQVRLEKSL